MTTETLYLSRRDIANLLEKLDAVRAGQASACTIIKNDPTHPVYPQSLRRIAVVAVETGDRYLPGVSPRLHLSRTALQALMALPAQPVAAPFHVDGINVFAVADDQYYVDRGTADADPVGDLGSAFILGRGKHK